MQAVALETPSRLLCRIIDLIVHFVVNDPFNNARVYFDHNVVAAFTAIPITAQGHQD